MANLTAIPLGPGQVRTSSEDLQALYKAVSTMDAPPSAWEGLFRLSCLLSDAPTEAYVTHQIQEAIENQGTDGDYHGDIPAGLATARAALALYEYGNSRDVLQSLLRYCSWLSANWADVISETSIRRSPADLMELLIKLYRYSGKTALLSLCERLRRESINWSGILHTYAVRRPTAMTASWLETRAGIDREHDADEGQYTRSYMISHAETIADGMRATMMNAMFSGSGDESGAGKLGWSRIQQWHGAVCGGTTADECVQGSDPFVAIDAASLGAWTEAFLTQLMGPDNTWAAEEADLLLHNGLAAAFAGGVLTPYQRVNHLDQMGYLRDCYHTHASEAHKKKCLSRIANAWTRAYGSAVMTTPEGCDVQFLLEGDYLLQMQDSAFRISIAAGNDADVMLSIQTRQAVKGKIRIRVPEWMHDFTWELNGQTQTLAPRNGYLTVLRTWANGDRVHISWIPRLEMLDTYHQGVAVKLGNTLYALDMSESAEQVAMVGTPRLEDNQVVADIAPLQDATLQAQGEAVRPALPVLPRVAAPGQTRVLSPYVKTPVRQTVFPKGQVQ